MRKTSDAQHDLAQCAHCTSIEYKRTAVHDDWECMRVHMPDILPITTSASPDNIMQISAHTNANLITLPGILDIASLFQMCKEESERAHTQELY